MKSNFKFIGLALPALALAAVIGCQSKAPTAITYSAMGTPTPGAYSSPALAPNYTMVCNFESAVFGGNTATANPTLFEIGAPSNLIQAPGGWAIVNNFPAYETGTMTIGGPGAGGTAQAAHVVGTLNDPGTGTYPSISLDGFLDGSSPFAYGAYNGSFFTGVKFYMNITANDTATDRHFFIPTVQPEASPLGTCVGTGCYNYFGYTLTGATNGWKLFTFDFSALAPTPYGQQPVPGTFTGVNLQQILRFRWQEGRANSAGSANIDFWVDEVQFY